MFELLIAFGLVCIILSSFKPKRRGGKRTLFHYQKPYVSKYSVSHRKNRSSYKKRKNKKRSKWL